MDKDRIIGNLRGGDVNVVHQLEGMRKSHTVPTIYDIKIPDIVFSMENILVHTIGLYRKKMNNLTLKATTHKI